jgi:hypothetical protein
MWHAVTPVSSGHDPILCESPEEKEVLVLNAGPGIVFAKAWSSIGASRERPSFQLELRPGDQRVISGKLVRVAASDTDFAAVAWRVLPKD